MGECPRRAASEAEVIRPETRPCLASRAVRIRSTCSADSCGAACAAAASCSPGKPSSPCTDAGTTGAADPPCAATPSPCPRTALTSRCCGPSSATCSTRRWSRPPSPSRSNSSRTPTRRAPRGARHCADELDRVDGELARYAEAIADAGPLDTILQAIRVREERRDAIRADLKVFTLPKAGEPDAREIRATLSGYLADWTAMAHQGVAEARRLLREVLVDRIVFRPVPRPPDWPPVKGPGRRAKLVYELVGEGSLSKLFKDLISVSLVVAPTGFEPVFQP